MKKKIGKYNCSVLLLTAVMAVGLTACGGNPQASGSPASNQATAAGSGNQAAAAYPEKQITLIAPSGAGGGIDGTARSFVKAMEEAKFVSQPILVENRPGGGQSVGLADFITQDKKNMHKLLLPSTPILINHLKKEGNSPHSFRDMTPLAQLVVDYNVIAVPANSKYKDLKEIFAELKANPKSLTIAGGSSPGSIDHLALMMPALKAGLDVKQLKYVPYDGGSDSIVATIGGNADVLLSDVSTLGEYIRAGKLRPVAIASPERLEGLFKDVPTYKEQGYDVEVTLWRGIFGPKEMSPEIAKYWEEKIKVLTESDTWKKEVESKGFVSAYKPGAEFQSYMEKQEAQLKEVLIELGMAK
jgi:putative tricarboxylic transport membrane protein